MKHPRPSVTTISRSTGVHYDITHLPARHPLQADIWQIARCRAGKRPELTWYFSPVEACGWVRQQTKRPLELSGAPADQHLLWAVATANAANAA